MTIRDEEIRSQLQLGEDSGWEFKQVEFSGNVPKSPERNDLADEITAFANSTGGAILCGVTNDGQILGMNREQMDELDRLLFEVSTDKIKPAMHIKVYRRQLDDRAFVLVKVPEGDSLHESQSRSFIRVGSSKRLMESDERLRLAQRRSQSRYLWFDEQEVSDTGFETLEESLWKPLLSAEGADDPEAALMRHALLVNDEADVTRATVAGVLLCTNNPHRWLPNATITATRYKGEDRSTGQFDSQEITGSLNQQIATAVAFVVRNMQVAARKNPARVNMPQYSVKAVFEAIVNAVVHRDYSMKSSNIRVSMFSNRLEILSPGALPNNLTVESMKLRQATRNQAIVSILGRMSVNEIPGSEERHYMMEVRGDGVLIIQRETEALCGKLPEYRVIDQSELLLVIPAATLELSPARPVITIWSQSEPLPGADVLVLFPNKTWIRSTTDDNGEAAFDLYTTDLPITVFVGAHGFAAHVEHDWIPQQGALVVNLQALPAGGSVIIGDPTGYIPGLKGRLNPIRDKFDRTYLYASNIAVSRGMQQPVCFLLGEELQLIDSEGVECLLRVVDVVGRSALLEYRSLDT